MWSASARPGNSSGCPDNKRGATVAKVEKWLRLEELGTLNSTDNDLTSQQCRQLYAAADLCRRSPRPAVMAAGSFAVVAIALASFEEVAESGTSGSMSSSGASLAGHHWVPLQCEPVGLTVSAVLASFSTGVAMMCLGHMGGRLLSKKTNLP